MLFLDPATHRLGSASLGFGFQPFQSGPFGWPGWFALFWNGRNTLDQLLQAMQGRIPILLAGAVRLRFDDDRAISGYALIRNLEQSLFEVIWQG